MRKLILLAITFIVINTVQVKASDEVNLNVWVEQTKTDEMPWDGCPHTFMQSPVNIMGLMGNAFHPSPPEIQLLILRSDGSMERHPNGTCNDTLKCDFRGIPLNNEVLGLLLYDSDASMRDLIDAMVMVPEKSQKWIKPAEKMKKRLQTVIGQFTPETIDLCRIHVAPRKVDILPFAHDECPTGGGCSLSQSTWSYSTGAPVEQGEWDWR